MTWNKDEPGGRDEPRGYHHGNLRETLIRAALELIAKKGAGRLHLRRRRALRRGQSGGAYRHFRDRDELMASVALRGFEQFEAALARAWDGGRPDAFVALDRLGKAYLEFARAQPAFYAAMFEAGIPLAANPPLGKRASAPSPCCAAPPTRSAPPCRPPAARRP